MRSVLGEMHALVLQILARGLHKRAGTKAPETVAEDMKLEWQHAQHEYVNAQVKLEAVDE